MYRCSACGVSLSELTASCPSCGKVGTVRGHSAGPLVPRKEAAPAAIPEKGLRRSVVVPGMPKEFLDMLVGMGLDERTAPFVLTNDRVMFQAADIVAGKISLNDPKALAEVWSGQEFLNGEIFKNRDDYLFVNPSFGYVFAPKCANEILNFCRGYEAWAMEGKLITVIADPRYGTEPEKHVFSPRDFVFTQEYLRYSVDKFKTSSRAEMCDSDSLELFYRFRAPVERYIASGDPAELEGFLERFDEFLPFFPHTSHSLFDYYFKSHLILKKIRRGFTRDVATKYFNVGALTVQEVPDTSGK